ncbi:MAG: hypothetical protein V4654_00170 [Bdellovibrionota bacterium]
MKKLILTFLVLVISFSAGATTLTGAALLNKVSLSLRGLPASVADQKAVSALALAEQKNFVDQKIDEYMKSSQYSEKVSLRLMELFQFKAAVLSKSITSVATQAFTDGEQKYAANNGAINLFRELTQENLSWDTLLTGKTYSISAIGTTFGISDYGFYGKLADLPNVGAGDVGDVEDVEDVNKLYKLLDRRITFASDDLRIAGVLTTGKFFTRYVTTGVNKNRRRAAAIFRVFLCDRMSAAIPEMAGIDDATYGILFPSQLGKDMEMTESEIKAVLNKNDSIHGNKPDCKSCHYKLDPVGRVFNNSGLILSSFPSAGALVFKNSSGQIVNKPVQGIAELAQKITEEPDYVSCQVQHFWNWYIGEDKVLTLQKRQQLISDFNSSGRRVNSFIKKMVTRAEFAEREEPNILKDTARNTKNLMLQCQSCHQNSDNYKGVDLSKWPLGDNPEYWINKISKSLDLDNMGKNRTMPPAEIGGFIPTKADLEMVKRWIDLGAPDESGKLQIQAKEVVP